MRSTGPAKQTSGGARYWGTAMAVLLLCAACSPAGEGAETESGSAAGSEARTPAREPGQTPPRGRAWVIIGTDTIVAEVARTIEERQEGLMFREDVPPGTGMLFVFDDVTTRSFWMKNTFVPLSIAFLDENQRIVDIKDMEPENEEFTRSEAPAIFALEVKQGWFAEVGIEVGDQAEIVFGPS